jgi:hypothetical protein
LSDATVLRAAARELAVIAATLRETSVHVTAALNDGAVIAALPRAPTTGLRTQRALLRAVTNRRGLGYAVAGGTLGTLGAKVGGVVGAESLAVLVMTTSLRLRIVAVNLDNPELTDDPLLRRLNEAVAADHQVESARALYALVRARGAAGALTGIAPVFGEVLALRALLDGNPLNDNTAWLIATGAGTATADPFTGMSNRAIAVLDMGEGAARRTHLEPGLRTHGSLLDFLTNLAVIGPTGRALIQVVSGPDGQERYVVMAPGMKMGTPDGDSPGDLLGAFSSTVLDSAPYSRALAKAIEDFGVPSGAEIALIGHSAGGAAILSLIQSAEFCARYEVTHAVAVGSPVDFKVPASARTWVASITNQHDIIPSLDGQGAGNCFDLHPDWYVVDYTDPTHLFPACHSIEHYTANLVDDLPEARTEIDRNLAPYQGPVTRSQLYRLYDQAPGLDGFPFLTVPTYQVGTYELPVRCRSGTALTAYFTADAGAAAALLGLGRAVGVNGRALVAVHAFRNHQTTLGAYDEIDLGIVVHDPWRPRPWRVWTDQLRRADHRRSGIRLLDSLLSSDAAAAAARELWGQPAFTGSARVELTTRSASVEAAAPDGTIMTLAGRLGPWIPSSAPDLVVYSDRDGTVLRSSMETRGRGRTHAAPGVRLAVGPSAHPMARHLRDLGLDGARPLLCLTTFHQQTRRGSAVPVLTR